MRTERTILGFLLAPRGRRLLAGAGWLAAGLAASATVYENPYEFTAEGDFDGNGFADVVVVDKTTGTYRLGYQQAGGTFNWVAARASGIENVSGFTVGKLNSTTRDALAFCAPEANRVNVLDATNPAVAAVPAPVYGPWIGPNSVLAIDIGGGGNTAHHDLNVGSQWNGPSATYQTLVRNDGTTNRTVLLHQAMGGAAGDANRIVLKTGTPERMGFFMRTSGTEVFRIYDFASGATVQLLSIVTAPTNRYLVGRFHPTNALSQVLFYRPGRSNFLSYQVTEPAPGTFSTTGPLSLDLGLSISQMFALSVGTTNKLLVLFDDGAIAKVYRYDGQNPPVALQTFTADPGEHFTGAAVMAGKFSLFSGSSGSPTSSQFRVYDSASLALVTSGDLPAIHALSGKANVLLFRYEPFVSSTPVLLRLMKGGDWSSALSLAGGPPPNVTVNVETFAGSSQGLDNPTPTPLGPSHPLATAGLVNQYSNFISLFSYSAPLGDEVSEVKVSPDAGTYKTAVNLVFTASNPTDAIYFRFGTTGAWLAYTNQAVHVFTNTTVFFYAQPAGGHPKSRIKSAAYAFTQSPSTLDSDGDGVPDYVETARGLDPVNSGSDGDDDGFTDLEELVANTSPTNSASHPPTNWTRLELKAVFDWVLTPRPRDGVNHTTVLCSNGTPVRAYTLQGSLLAHALATNVGLPGVLNPAVRLSNIVVETRDRLVASATELHYDIQTPAADTRIGREMLRLVSVPAVQAVTVPYSYGGGALATEANNWVNAASNAYAASRREMLTNQMTINDTLVALLCETKIAEILQTRGSNWWSNLTLFPFRPSDVARTNPSQSTLLALESRTSNGLPGWRLQTLYSTISNLTLNSTLGSIVNLRAVAANIYDICSAYNNTNPATFASPVDELRYFLWHGTLDSNYLAVASTSNLFASAIIGADTILAAVPPRPTTNLTLVTRADSFLGYCRTFDIESTAVQVNLFDASGVPYAFPESFNLLPGSRIQVFAYTDIDNATCAGQDLEVISIGLASVPLASDFDTDGNLLLDTWERLFLEGLGSDPFGDADGDGYSNLQEMFEGSDPSDFYGIPTFGVVNLHAPVLEMIPDGALIRLRFDWPAVYITKIRIHVKSTPDLNTPFTDVPVGAPAALGSDRWEVTVPTPASWNHFFLIYLSLAPLTP